MKEKKESLVIGDYEILITWLFFGCVGFVIGLVCGVAL